jgi:hypothetical protein
MVADVPKSALFFGTSLLTRVQFKGRMLIIGGAGLLPYLGTSVATIGLAREASIAAQGMSPPHLSLPGNKY